MTNEREFNPNVRRTYFDRRFQGTKDKYLDLIEHSTTLYVGNLSFTTTEDQIYELFSKIGIVKEVIMGRNKYTHELCGFCFVIYFTHEDALDALKYISVTHLDNRLIRCDVDRGFEEGRQFGRGYSGGQVRDEFRTSFDKDRGGLRKAQS